MNADEVSWLLRTIEDPETATRFVHAQYERGRISHQVIAALAREHGCIDYPSIQVATAAATSMDCVTARQAF